MPIQQHQKVLNVGRAHFSTEVKRRTPWILLSVVAGIAMVLVGETYEKQLSDRIELVFFVPMIVYMSDIIGTETLALVVRGLATDRMEVRRMFGKELAVGLTLGLASGVPMGLFSLYWFRDFLLAWTVAFAMVINGAVAVLVGAIVPALFSRLGRDPAIGTDEISTALSDNLSILIYLGVATTMLFAT
jgi:magnesium transporter